MTRKELEELATLIANKTALANETLLTPKELAQELKVSLSSLRDKWDMFPYVQIAPRQRRYLKSQVLQVLIQQG